MTWWETHICHGRQFDAQEQHKCSTSDTHYDVCKVCGPSPGSTHFTYVIISIRYSVNANWFCLSVCPGKAIRPLWPVKRLVFFNQYWKFYLTQIKVMDSGCLRGRCKKTKRAPQRRKCVNVVLKRGHFNMLCPLKGHLRGHFIMFNPPFRHQEGTFAASFRPWKVHHRIYFDTLSYL